MDMQISIHDALLLFLGIAAFVALIVLIVVLIKLFKTLKNVDDVLDDVKIVTSISSKRVEKIDDMVDEVVKSATTVVRELNQKDGLIRTATSMARATTNLFSYFKSSKKDNDNL